MKLVNIHNDKNVMVVSHIGRSSFLDQRGHLLKSFRGNLPTNLLCVCVCVLLSMCLTRYTHFLFSSVIFYM